MSTKFEHVTHRIYIRAGYKDNSSKDICVTAVSADDREAGVSLDDSNFLDPDEPYHDSIVDVTIPIPVRTQVADTTVFVPLPDVKVTAVAGGA